MPLLYSHCQCLFHSTGRTIERNSLSDAVTTGGGASDGLSSLGLGHSTGVGGIVCAVPRKTDGSPDLYTRPYPGKIALLQVIHPSCMVDYLHVNRCVLNVYRPACRLYLMCQPGYHSECRSWTFDCLQSQRRRQQLLVCNIPHLYPCLPSDVSVLKGGLEFRSTPTVTAFRSFSLDDVEDDLVRTIGEMAARLRTSKALAEARARVCD